MARLARIPADGTITSPPNTAGEHEQRDSAVMTGNRRVRLYNGASQGNGDVWWDCAGLFEGEYTGPWFDGATGRVVIDGVERKTEWDGDPDESTSRATDFAVTDRLLVERSVDDGVTWEPVAETPERVGTFTDYQSLSRGITLYRVTAYTDEDATTEVIIPVEATSGAVWLGGGPGFSVQGRLPFNPTIKVIPARETALKGYAGRSKPVVDKGPMTSWTAEVSGSIEDHDVTAEHTANVDRLTEIVHLPDRLHQLRTPDGLRKHGAVEAIPMPRIIAGNHPQGWNGIWQYSFTFIEGD